MNVQVLNLSNEQQLFTNIPNIQWNSQKLTLALSDVGLKNCQIELRCDADGWVAIQEAEAFNYSPDICGPIFGGGFNPLKEYIITVELKSEQLAYLSIMYLSQNIEEWLEDSEVQRLFKDVDNFLLITVMQQFTPKTQWGMSTIYSDTHHPTFS